MDEKKLQEIKEAMLDHKRKMETDLEYRKRCEEIGEKLDRVLPNFGKDTE